MTHTQQINKDLDGRVAELVAEKQHADEELRKFKVDHDITMEKYMKEMAEMKRRETLSKTSEIYEFKALDEYKEAVEEATFLYFGKGFNLCRKQISTLHPDLDIHNL